MAVICTAGQGAESPLGQLRARALALPNVKRGGCRTTASSPDFAIVEWAVPAGADLDAHPEADGRRQPASGSPRRRSSVSARRCPTDRSDGSTSASGPRARAPCSRRPAGSNAQASPSSTLTASRSSSASTWAPTGRRQGSHGCSGTASSSTTDGRDRRAASRERGRRARRQARPRAPQAREVAADPWHTAGALSDGWARRGLAVVEVPQHDARMVPAFQQLTDLVNSGNLVHGNEPALNAAVENSVQRRPAAAPASARPATDSATTCYRLTLAVHARRPAAEGSPRRVDRRITAHDDSARGTQRALFPSASIL